MHIPFRKATYGDAAQHGEALTRALYEKEEMQALCARAASLGVEVEISLRHTWCDDVLSVPSIPEREGRLSHGYVMELWFDLVAEGRVLMSQGEFPVQLSLSVLCAKETGIFPFTRLSLLPLDEVLDEGSVLPVLEEYLDRVEEEGYTLSPLLSNRLYPDVLPEGEVGLLPLDGVESGAHVELSSKPYTGAVGGEDSLYLAKSAFLPYELLLTAVCTRPWEGDNPRYLTLSEEETEALALLLEELPSMMRRRRDFADLLSEAGVSHLSAPPAAEYLCHCLTYGRKKQFLRDAEALLTLLREGDGTLTLID